jgi:hypothetical protein
MQNLSELAKGGTLCLSKAGLIVGSDTAKVQIAAPNGAGVDFAIKGYLYYKVSADDFFTLSGDIQTVLYTCIYLLSIDKTGAAHCTQGTEVLTADITAGLAALTWPVAPDDCCAIGAVKVKATSALFNPGTTALGTGNTVVYYDLFAVPDAPIVA